MNYRNTRQKYIILKVIKENRCHPTIAEICQSVQKLDSSIGQATVYRNVKKFLKDGKITQIKTKNGIDRYDYYPHSAHFECLACGRIFDISDDELLENISFQISGKDNIIGYRLMLEGYCQDCEKSNY